MTDPRTDRSAHEGPGRSTDEILGVLDQELSRADRLRYLTVGLASLAVTAVTGTLWATEASLPLRTHLAFAGIPRCPVGPNNDGVLVGQRRAGMPARPTRFRAARPTRAPGR